jgi:hypothetical protein
MTYRQLAGAQGLHGFACAAPTPTGPSKGLERLSGTGGGRTRLLSAPKPEDQQ